MNRFSVNLALWTSLFLLLILSACTPEEPENEEEEIDTVTLTLNDGTTATWRVDDTTDPTLTLAANTTYTVEATFLNEEENEDVTEEVKEEDDEHLVCYEVTGGANLDITATDSDGNFPIGLSTEWVAGAASMGTLQTDPAPSAWGKGWYLYPG